MNQNSRDNSLRPIKFANKADAFPGNRHLTQIQPEVRDTSVKSPETPLKLLSSCLHEDQVFVDLACFRSIPAYFVGTQEFTSEKLRSTVTVTFLSDLEELTGGKSDVVSELTARYNSIAGSPARPYPPAEHNLIGSSLL